MMKAKFRRVLISFFILSIFTSVNFCLGDDYDDICWMPHDVSKYEEWELSLIRNAANYLRGEMKQGRLRIEHLNFANSMVRGTWDRSNTIRGVGANKNSNVGCQLPLDEIFVPKGCKTFQVGPRHFLEYPAPPEVPRLMNDFLKLVNRERAKCSAQRAYNLCRGAAGMIHPYSDGNGRTLYALQLALTPTTESGGNPSGDPDIPTAPLGAPKGKVGRVNLGGGTWRGQVTNGALGFAGGFAGEMAAQNGYGGVALGVGLGMSGVGGYAAGGLPGAGVNVASSGIGMGVEYGVSALGYNETQAAAAGRLSGIGTSFASGGLPGFYSYATQTAASDLGSIGYSWSVATSNGMSTAEFAYETVTNIPHYWGQMFGF
jgi:hypothetical protein